MSQTILEKANEYAKILHSKTARKDGGTTYDHILRVKQNLEDIKITDENTLAAALLHQSIAKSGITPEEITKEFNEDIAQMVCKLTEISELQIPISEGPERIINLHKLFIQLASDIRVLIIRLADRIDNIETIKSLDSESQKWAAEKSEKIYAPISKAIGIHAYTNILEDEALKVKEPEHYRDLEILSSMKFKRAEKKLHKATNKIIDFLTADNIAHEVTYRQKSISSMSKKLHQYYTLGKINSLKDIDSLYDLLGIRILVDDIDNCYKTLAFVQENWQTIDEEFDDYIQRPKSSGYKTLQVPIHLDDSIVCELQIRTFEMHEVNEYGQSSHFAYKYGNFNKKDDFTWIKNLISQKEEIQGAIGNKSNIKLFEDTMFVFTPTDELITLPAGSTPIDFAYAVHTDIGDHAKMAKVNGRPMALNSELKSGDKIEIIVDKNHKPSQDWLKFVKTPCAKNHIKKSMEM